MSSKQNFRPFKRRKNHREHSRAPAADGVQQLWGLHTVEEALRNPRREHLRLMATENAWRKLEDTGAKIQPTLVRPQEIDKILGRDTVHQGVLLESRPLASPSLEDLESEGCVLALDQITDPHNVGAILRTAAAFGVKA
ncbi:MAG: RNA methyltransferase substrate-binding domain-containing protein, partial [Pseudomonadota bacterium]